MTIFNLINYCEKIIDKNEKPKKMSEIDFYK